MRIVTSGTIGKVIGLGTQVIREKRANGRHMVAVYLGGGTHSDGIMPNAERIADTERKLTTAGIRYERVYITGGTDMPWRWLRVLYVREQ